MAKKSAKKQAVGWTASTIMDVDRVKAKAEGFLADFAVITFPSTKVVPHLQPGFWVMFLDFILHGLSLPAHEFLRGLLFVGVKLHHLTPNSILHIACFITMCEAFLGINPHWGLWKYLLCLRCNMSKEEFMTLVAQSCLCDQKLNT
jgi:hypothetical protein